MSTTAPKQPQERAGYGGFSENLVSNPADLNMIISMCEEVLKHE